MYVEKQPSYVHPCYMERTVMREPRQAQSDATKTAGQMTWLARDHKLVKEGPHTNQLQHQLLLPLQYLVRNTLQMTAQ